MRKLKKILKIAVLGLLISISVLLLTGQILRFTASVEPPAGELVDVGGYKLHINCVGPEEKIGGELPTVIVESGAGVSSPVYHWIQDGVSKTTKVCVYDRAGLGWSDPSDLTRDGKTINTALHALLDKVGIKRPFVFVGHSIAGLYMRDYVERYPDEVAGLVFLDPSHPKQYQMIGISDTQMAEQMESIKTKLFVVKLVMKLGVLEVFNPLNGGDMSSYPENIRKQTGYLSKQPEHIDTVLIEAQDFKKAAEQAEQNKSLGNRPVVVISATKEMQPGTLPEGVSSEKYLGAFSKLHNEIASLSTRGEHVNIDTASHMSLITNKENAEKAVTYIIKVVQESASSVNNAGRLKQ
jgi:pimeloyl-ACP methyl ester carboxylesterase